jgi:hypothetical protein
VRQVADLHKNYLGQYCIIQIHLEMGKSKKPTDFIILNAHLNESKELEGRRD